MANKEITTTEKKVEANNSLIIAPRITEKASLQSNSNAYTFIVSYNATKLGLMAEIKKNHKVTPVKITIANYPGKIKMVRGRAGSTSGYKKAVVFLKKGEVLNIGQ